MTPDLTDPGVYTAWTTDRVRFSDTDAMGHVNNVAYAAYVETGRVGFGLDLVRTLDLDAAGVILARVAIDYRQQAHYPGEVQVGSRLMAVGRTSFTVGTGVFYEDRCVATAESVLVVLGPDGPMPIEGPGRERLEDLAGA